MVDVDVEGMQRVRLNDIPYPLAIPRFITITCLLFHACRTGIPAIAEPGSKGIGLTVSFAPITSVTSVLPKSSLISSISSTTAKRKKGGYDYISNFVLSTNLLS